MRAIPFIVETQVDYAEMLIRRAAPGDAGRAAALLEEAAETARRFRFTPLGDRAAQLLVPCASLSPVQPDLAASTTRGVKA